MSDYTRVLKGLRHCINLDGLEPNDTRIRCHGCPYFTEPTRCGGILMRDAAAAIEELQAEQKKTVTQIFGEEQQKWEEYCTGLMNRIRELKAQMPKRGEWIKDEEQSQKHVEAIYRCSACHNFDAWGATELYPYCPNCGAKMEVQE